MRVKQQQNLPMYYGGKEYVKPNKKIYNQSSSQPSKIRLLLGLIVVVFALYFLGIVYSAYPFMMADPKDGHKKVEVRVLHSLVDIQNKTIHAVLTKLNIFPYLYGFHQSKTASQITVTPSEIDDYRSPADKECDSRYGQQLVKDWRKTEEIWCKSDGNSVLPSTLKCYPFLQKHREEQGKGKDVFCTAENFVIDFNWIFGDVAPEDSKLFYKVAYLDILMNFVLQSTCKRTSLFYLPQLAPHIQQYFSSFQDGLDQPPEYTVHEETTTYFLPRDEDSENAFHCVADFFNMFLVKEILQIDVQDQQVLIMDKMPNSPYVELLRRAFAPIHGVHRHGKYAGQKVLFKKLIFHLESPASLVFPETATKAPQRCRDASLFHAYRRHVLRSFQLWDVPPPVIPTATLILRHRTLTKNVGRVMANENEVIKNLQARGNMMRLQIVDLATLSYGEQIQIIRSSNILIGVHGAGLTWIMMAAEEAVLLEIHPSYREDRHFRHIARLTGKDYMPMRSLTRETCKLTSDNVIVPIPEFIATVNGAVRLARNYESGISECGLYCAPTILAINERLSGLYDDPTILNVNNRTRSKGIDKTFPCPEL